MPSFLIIYLSLIECRRVVLYAQLLIAYFSNQMFENPLFFHFGKGLGYLSCNTAYKFMHFRIFFLGGGGVIDKGSE